MSLLFNMLSRLVTTFLPRSKHLLITWLQSPSAVILEPKRINSATVSTVSPSVCHEVMGPDAMILVFWMLSFKPTFSLSSFTFIKRLFSVSFFEFCHKCGVIWISEVTDIHLLKKKKKSEVIVRCYLHWFKCKVPHCKVSASSGHRNLSVLTLNSYLLSVRVTLAFQPVFGQANLHISNNTKSVMNNKFWWNSHRIGALHYREQNPRLLWLDGLDPTAGSHCSLFSTLKSWGSSQRFGFHLTLTMQFSL